MAFSLLRYYGAKAAVVHKILPHFPAHDVFVDAFGGSGSVLFNKERSRVEVFNDLNDEVVNLFDVLRDEDRAATLAHLCELTPYSRTEYARSYEPTDDPVERARRLLVRATMGHAMLEFNDARTGFRADRIGDPSRQSVTQDWLKQPDKIKVAVERLKGVVVENRPAVKVIGMYDTPDTLHYLDPPYTHDTRESTQIYSHEMSAEDHEELADCAHSAQGMVVLSGYDSPLYRKLFADWQRVEFKGRVAQSNNGANKRKRVEVLWMNAAAAGRSQQANLFN